MAASNLVIYTGNYFDLDEIDNVYLAYMQNPTWDGIAGLTLNSKIVRKATKVTADGKKWKYEVNEDTDGDYKFNVIMLTKDNKSTNSFTLLAYGAYSIEQYANLSEDWQITISATWTVRDQEETDPSTNFEKLYDEHVLKTDARTGTLTIFHNKLIKAGAVPASYSISDKVSSYQNKGVKPASGTQNTGGVCGVNIINNTNNLAIAKTDNNLNVAGNRGDVSAQWLVLNPFIDSDADVISLYAAPNESTVRSRYKTTRYNKLDLNKGSE